MFHILYYSRNSIFFRNTLFAIEWNKNMIEFVLIALCFLLIAFFVAKIAQSGFFSTIQPVISESPKYLSKTLIVYYKHHIGSYWGISPLFKEVKELLPHGAITFGIYYDNPEKCAEHLLQSAVGVIFGEDGKMLYTDNYAEQLTRWGYEKMVLPKVDRAVQVTQPYTSFLSLFGLVYRTYGIMKQYIEEHRLETSYAVEFYDKNELTLAFLLDHAEEFIVPEHLTLEELESKLARKKFDSDEEDSESEVDATEEEGKEETEEKEEKKNIRT